MYKTGVFLARMQPLHVAHMFLIKKALEECETVWVVLGSANKKDMQRNPFSLDFRKDMLTQALSEEGYSSEYINRIHIFELPDWSLENDTNETYMWGRYLYFNIVSRAETKKFTIYYSDSPEIIKSWFPSDIADNITLRLFDRTQTYDGLSATKIREALINQNTEYISKYCPPVILRNLGYISKYYQNVLEAPSSDFSME